MSKVRQRNNLAHAKPKAGFGTLSGRQRESVCPSHGLINAPGDNNCFLNSAVQIFWHLDLFRRGFRTIQEHVCLGNACIFCGIKMLFRQFQESADTALAPDMLRRALASTFEDQQRFQLGCMDDAAECFENILLRIHYHIRGTSEVANCSSSSCLPHRIFAMNILESFSCNDCHTLSEPLVYQQMVHYVSAEALCEKALQMRQRGLQSLTGLFGKLIRKANEDGDQRTCRCCSSSNALLKRTLTNRPAVVTLGLAWPSEKPNTKIVADVLNAIDTNICLCHLYQFVSDTEWASSAVHHLVGMICFRSRHYSAFFYHPRYKTWMYFDDATVKTIGPEWSQVVSKCVKNQVQPLLLFYADPDSATPTEISSLPSEDTRFLPQGNASDMPRRSDNSVKCAQGTISHRPAPPRPPLRTVSRSYLPNQGIDHNPDGHTVTASNDPAGGASDARLTGRIVRQNSRSSMTSSSIASVESYDSLEQFRFQPRSRDSFQEAIKEDTDSGYPSGDQASASSASSSSVEIQLTKPSTLRRQPLPTPTPSPTVSQTQSVQMVLRADDLIASAVLKESKSDLSGAIRLFEQAASLLQSCLEPLKSCSQLYGSVVDKQKECYDKLSKLHERALSRNSSVFSVASSTQRNDSHMMATMPRKVLQKTSECSNESLQRMHKSRRKIVARESGLGSRNSNRSLPDLSQTAGDLSIESKKPPLSKKPLSTFQSSGTNRQSTGQDSLLEELNRRFRERSQKREKVLQETFDDFPPPPPDLLLMDESKLDLIPKVGNGQISINQLCTLCGQKMTNLPSIYCSDCQVYINRFKSHC